MNRTDSWSGDVWTPWWGLGLLHRWKVVHSWATDAQEGEPARHGDRRTYGVARSRASANARMLEGMFRGARDLPRRLS
jgi:hypothetical protein